MFKYTQIITKNEKNEKLYHDFFYHTDTKKALVVIFPGNDNTCYKPLLYYAKKVALHLGHDVLCMYYYHTLDSNIKKKDIVKECYDAIRVCLNHTYETIYFISQNEGTDIAGQISLKFGYENVNNLYLSPLKESISHIIQSNCFVTIGTKDKDFTIEYINGLKKYDNVKLKIFKDANQQLECEDINTCIKILIETVNIYKEFLK